MAKFDLDRVHQRPGDPPRLLGVSLSARPPLAASFVPLRGLTTVLGPNASGKTTVLHGVANAISDLHGCYPFERDWEQWELDGMSRPRSPALFFFDADEAHLTWLARSFGITDRDLAWPLGGWPSRLRVPDRGREATSLDDVIAILGDAFPGDVEDWARIAALVRRSSLVAVEPGTAPGLVSAYWCLPRAADLSPNDVAAIERLSLRATPADARHNWRNDWVRPREHLTLSDAPIMVAPLGSDSLWEWLPITTAVPRDTDDMSIFVRDALAAVLCDLSASGDPEEEPTTSRRHAWFSHSRSAAVHRHATPAARALGRVATHLCPEFLSDRYEIFVTLPPVPDWSSDGPEPIIELHGTHGPLGGPWDDLAQSLADDHFGAEYDGWTHGFALSRAASGYQLWCQLALLEACAVLRSFGEDVRAARAREAYELELPVNEPDAERIAERIAELVAERHSLINRLEAAGAVVTIGGDPADAAEAAAELAERRELRNRVYVIDEPERHLHPRLEREAARWLGSLAGATNARVLLTSHSPRFLSSGLDNTLVYLQPSHLEDPDGLGRAFPSVHQRFVTAHIDAAALSALDVVSSEMGFDRGELLSTVRCLLFVEGEADQRVLRALFGRLLHSEGIAVIPIHGAVGAEQKGVVDAEVLLRWTGALPAIMLDHVAAADWQRLEADPEFRRKEASSGKHLESRVLARILERSVALDRPVVALPIAQADIFDVLDEEIVKQCFGAFPGHFAARQAAARSPQGWKSFYRSEYRVDVTPDTVERIAVEMALASIVPTELSELIDKLLLALRQREGRA